MLPIDPTEIEHLLGTASAAAGAAGAAGARVHRWRDWRGKRSAEHKQARALYLEVVGNLLLCRIGQGTHPPQLIVATTEWRRPDTLPLLAGLLDIEQLGVVAAAYALLETYERLFQLPWTELLPVRLHGNDLVVIGQVADRFAEAELALRCTPWRQGPGGNGEGAHRDLRQDPGAQGSLRSRLSNTWRSVPVGTLLAVVSALAGACLAAALLNRWSRS